MVLRGNGNDGHLKKELTLCKKEGAVTGLRCSKAMGWYPGFAIFNNVAGVWYFGALNENRGVVCKIELTYWAHCKVD